MWGTVSVMLRELLTRVFENFATAATQPLKGHTFADYLRVDVPRTLRSITAGAGLEWKASPGQGRWVEAPWIAALDPVVTDSAQREYYPVYLFSRDMSEVYLSMNQGMTEVEDDLGASEARDELRQRARLLRLRAGKRWMENFPNVELQLQAKSPSTRLAMYESGNVFAARYSRAELPDENSLVTDLLLMLEIYRVIVMNGGYGGLEIRPESIVPEPSGVDGRRRYTYHRTIERNQKLVRKVKAALGYCCQVCGFDYRKIYGELGSEYIEAHHRTPISQLQGPALLTVEAFAVLCANCHRMMHRQGSPDSIEELRTIVENLGSSEKFVSRQKA